MVKCALCWDFYDRTGGAANALELTVVDSLTTSNPFGVLFDGTNVWFSTGVGGNVIHKIDQTAAGMPIIGSPVTLTGGGTGALAWDGSHFVSAADDAINFFNTNGSLSSVTAITAPVSGFDLIDGLDFDHNEIWYSPDVGNVYRLDTAGAFTGPVNPVLGGAGGFSGVERVDAGGNSFLIVVNDAFSPRRLCQVSLTGSFNLANDCAILSNTRYEDLAFDGRYLYAADVFGNRLDKIDLTGAGGGSIFEPPSGVPEPATLTLLLTGLGGLFLLRRKV
jgi:hypothetical protein